MIKPSMGELLTKVDSRYSLVIAVAKRARQLTEDTMSINIKKVTKPVLTAIKEIDSGKVICYRD